MSQDHPRLPGPGEQTGQEPHVPAADPALALPARRRAESAVCLNCGTELQGPFCHYCGQPDRNFLRFFPALVREALAEFIDLDSRFMRTMKPLLFKPGRLTRDYLEGRRFRYTPPLRLYLFASIAFFLLAAVLSTNAIELGVKMDPSSGEANLSISSSEEAQDLTPEQRQQVEQALAEAGVENPTGFMEGFEAGWKDSPKEAGGEGPFTADQIMVDGKPWDREANPVELQYLPDFVNAWINDEIEESPQKARRIAEDPNLIIQQLFDLLPGTMFVLLPVVALLLKFWYLFAKRFYVEHLIFSLHIHAFVFVSLTLLLLLGLADSTALVASTPVAGNVIGWLTTAIVVWVPVYILVAMHHVYRQNWFLTLCKFGLIGISYASLLAIFTAIVAVLGFVLL